MLVQQRLGVSERKACKVLGQARSTQRHSPKVKEDEEALRADMIDLARRFGRYGYRMITGMLRAEGWPVNHKRVDRIWKQEGLKVPKKQPKRGRIWLNDGSCIRLRPLYKHHVWSYDFVADRTHDGRPIRMLAVLDEYSRECLAIKVARNLKSDDVLEVLKREIFFTLAEAKVLIEQWRREYKTIRPHSSLGDRPPAPEAIRPDPAFLNLPALRGPHPMSQGGLD